MSLNRPFAVLSQCEQHTTKLTLFKWHQSHQPRRCLHNSSRHQAALEPSRNATSSNVGADAAVSPRRQRSAAVSKQISRLREGPSASKRGPRPQAGEKLLNFAQHAKGEDNGSRPAPPPKKRLPSQKFATRDEAIRASVQRNNTTHQRQYSPVSYTANYYTAAGLGAATPAGHNHAGVIADRLASLTTESSASTVGLPIQAAKVRSGRSIFLADPITAESPAITTTRPRLGGRAVRDAQIMSSSDKAALDVGPLDPSVRDEVATRMAKGVYYTRESLVEGEKRWASLPVLETVLRTTVQNGTYSEKDVRIVAEKVAALMPAAAARTTTPAANKRTGKATAAAKN